MDKINEEAEASKKKSNDEMFVNPNVSLEIKHSELSPEPPHVPVITGEMPEGFAKPREPEVPMDRNGNYTKVIDTPKKAKKKLTQKQLDALAKGRETSMKNRVAKAKKSKEDKAEASNAIPIPKQKKQVHYEEPPPMPNPNDRMGGMPQQQQLYQQAPIDYDKIINGVADIYTQRQQQRVTQQNEAQQKQVEADKNVAMFEEHIRQDERIKLMKKYEEQEKQKVKAKALKTTNSVYSRPSAQDTSNPYAYAFNMNSRNNFKRY